MFRISMPFLVFGLLTAAGSGAERKFPYEATVSAAEEFVRSGAGQTYYPTSKLRRGARVTVHRHDPGGWLMITPPEGSFSWIQADYVRRKNNNAGVLTENDVIVRVGSEFNDDRDWYQRKLSKGDAVEILEEKTFETDRGPVKMLKIKPPSHEYRWIMGRALTPADAPVRKPLKESPRPEAPAKPNLPVGGGVDPFADGPKPTIEDVADQAPPREKDRGPTLDAVHQTGPDVTELGEIRSRLSAVDKELHAMIEDDPATWNLIGIEQQYKQLEEQTELPAFKTQIRQRLKSIDRYTKLKQEYEEFMRVSAETKARDAQLMSLKSEAAAEPNAGSPASTLPNPTAPPVARPAPALPKSFDGAGIIQRAPTNVRGGPQFVLMTPTGRRLAYLQPAPGVDLNAYVGQSMGVIGQRSYRQELQGELIVVRSLTPVKLKGTP